MENMKSKEQIQLSNPIYVAVEKERIYENKQISISGEMKVDGVLQFKNCVINAEDAKIKVNGKLYMEGCEVHQLVSEFLYLEENAEATVKDSEFHCSLPFHDSVMIARGNRNILIQNCRFYGTPSVISTMTKRGCRSVQPFEVPLVDANKGRIEGCKFENFTGCRVANVLYLVDTVFENCHRIEVGGSGEKTRVTRCSFTNCKEINVYDGVVECCAFDGIGELYACLGKIMGCSFRNLRVSLDYAIFLEDCNMENCIFDDAEISGNVCLIESTDESCLSYCKFVNCRTSRDDLKLVHAEGTQGRLIKKMVEYDIVDHETCTGLDSVEKLGEGR